MRTLIAYGDYEPWNKLSLAFCDTGTAIWGKLPPFYQEKSQVSSDTAPKQIYLQGKTLEDSIKEGFAGWTIEQPELDAGHFYPRIWRRASEIERHGEPLPRVEDTQDLGSFVNSLEQIECLFDDLSSIFRVVHPAKDNLDSYGGAIRDIIILACTEVEAQWKGVLEAHNVKASGKHYNTTDYVKLLPVMKLDRYKVALVRYPRIAPTAPFEGWNVSAPTTSLLWYDAYNNVKHDREAKFSEASLRHAIEAVAACLVLLAAQFGVEALNRHRLKNLFEFKDRPRWEPKEWYYQPVPGQRWARMQFPF